MTGGATAERSERWERSPCIVGGAGGAAALVNQAAALGVRLEARLGGRLWADRPDLLPTTLRDSLAADRAAVLALLAGWPMQPAPVPQPARARGILPGSRARAPAPALPGVPLEWCEGVALLATRPAPATITPRRWAALAATSAQMLRDHGAALHGAGWGVLDLFGLHFTAPMTHPPGWGLAWLLGEQGEVLDVAPDVIGMRREPDGARLAYRCQVSGRGGAVPAWLLICPL